MSPKRSDLSAALTPQPKNIRSKRETSLTRRLLQRSLALLVSLGLLVSCTGCNTYKLFPESFDVQRLIFTRILAIDSVDHGENKIRVTMASRMISGAANDPTKKIEVLSSEGRTIFEAVRNFSNRVDKEIFLGHLDYILLGQEAAQLDLTEFLDTLLRDPLIRKSTCIVACTNMKAEEFLLKGSTEEAFPAERLDNLFLGERLLSQSSHSESIDSQHFFTQNNRIKTIDFLRDLNSLTKTAIIPCLSELALNEEQSQADNNNPEGQKEEDKKPEEEKKAEEPEKQDQGKESEQDQTAEAEAEEPAGGANPSGGKGEGESEPAKPGNQMFALDGYAVYKDRLVGYLNGNQGRAANFLLGRVFSGHLPVQAPDGKNISLEIISCDREFVPEWNDKGKLLVEINIDMKTSIAESQSDADIYTSDYLNDLIAQQNKIVEKEIADLLKFTKENKCDLVGFGKLFAHKYPVRFRTELADTWADEGYKKIDFSINVKSLIEHSRNLQGPLLGD